jgi:hypothetical protein
MANYLPVKGGECRVPTLQGAEDDVTAARAGVHHTHSCLPVKGGDGHISTVQGAEDDMAAARTGVHYQLFTCERKRLPRPYSAGSRRRHGSSQDRGTLSAVYL